MQEPFGRRGRLVAGVALLAVLAGLVCWAGTIPGDLTDSDHPTEVDVTQNREAYVGERVALGGRVVETDPVVIATRASGSGRFTLVNENDTLQNGDELLERGDSVTAFGTLEDESTLAVERTTVGDTAGTAYMLLISFVAGLWVAGRFARDWRFDRDRLAFVRRDDPLSLWDVIARPRGIGSGGDRGA
ncbi:hypothetical protein [Natrinema versiforme]|uniref:Uncharacterized protein n=1 Tax=Natrinema versiforme JCM 10478 TaxID=1227496 RepID=L9Y071_9EURY|nr:hypothetical protein [Natrinema versiforme]ELY67440.1 hypothetical protein C489_10129 [Natrinema versiforme JCM 10478]